MLEDKLVSVVVPAYNAEHTLDATLNSIRKQTYRNLEVAVVNDGSTDATTNIAKKHAEEDDRIKVISIPNGGVANARNIGISETRGSLIAFVDSDDLWHPDKIAIQVQAIEEGGKDTGYVYCLSRRVDGQDRTLGSMKTQLFQGNIYLRSVVYNPVGNGSSMLARREALEGAGGYNSDPELQGAEDNLAQIIISRKWRVVAVPRYLTGYRVVENSLSSDFEHMARRRLAVLRHVSESFPETPSTALLLAEGRIRAMVAVQAFRRYKLWQGLSEMVRALHLAPLCTLEIVAANTGANVRSFIGSGRGHASDRLEKPNTNFFDCDPASPVGPPRRPVETRKLRQLAGAEEWFRNRYPAR